jgi:hypothetical protein
MVVHWKTWLPACLVCSINSWFPLKLDEAHLQHAILLLYPFIRNAIFYNLLGFINCSCLNSGTEFIGGRFRRKSSSDAYERATPPGPSTSHPPPFEVWPFGVLMLVFAPRPASTKLNTRQRRMKGGHIITGEIKNVRVCLTSTVIICRYVCSVSFYHICSVCG